MKIAVIENEYGAVSIDTALVEENVREVREGWRAQTMPRKLKVLPLIFLSLPSVLIRPCFVLATAGTMMMSSFLSFCVLGVLSVPCIFTTILSQPSSTVEATEMAIRYSGRFGRHESRAGASVRKKK